MLSTAAAAATFIVVAGLYPARAGTLSSARSAQRVAQFLSLAEKGLDGDFELTYAVIGTNGDFFRGGSGTLFVAQSAPAGRSAWRTGPGSWSFRLEDNNGANAQWIETGSSAEDCWRDSGGSALRCTGPTEYSASNGFMLSTLPFIEGAAVDGLLFLIDPPGARSLPMPASLTLSTRPGSRLTGPLSCLSLEQSPGTTTCITRRGVIASVTNFDSLTLQWRSVRLISEKSASKGTDFEPEGKLTQPFEVPPV
jgi:hypothetical protein